MKGTGHNHKSNSSCLVKRDEVEFSSLVVDPTVIDKKASKPMNIGIKLQFQ